MTRCRTKLKVVFAIGLLAGLLQPAFAKTWHLQEDAGWQDVSQSPDSQYLLAVSQVKQLIHQGRPDRLREQYEQLKQQFPEIAGNDLDAFIQADLLFACGHIVKAVRAYDQFLDRFPDSQLYHAALDRQFTIATAFLAGRKKRVLKLFRIKGYAEGVKIMQRISDRAGDDPISLKAAVSVAQNYEKRKKFNQAYQQWSQIASRWPVGQTAQNALLAMARCNHAAYMGPRHDSSPLISARSYYQQFKARYPQKANHINVSEKLKQINEQLAYKQFSIAQYYQKTGSNQAANFYYQMVIDNWPQTAAAQSAKEKMEHQALWKKPK